MKARAGWLVAAAVCLAGFVGLALSVSGSTSLATVDVAVQQAVTATRSRGRTMAFEAFTTVGTLPVVVGAALTGVLILVRRTRSWVPPLVLIAAVALSALTIALVKVGVGRLRPGPADRIGPAALDFAFPSGHTGNGTTAVCLVTTLVCLTLPRSASRSAALAGAVLLSVGIGVSRVYLGYHWPSDVVGGWLLAGTFTCAAVYLVLVLGARDFSAPTELGASAVTSAERGR